MKCPICGCLDFFVKDPDDEYETYAFELQDDKIHFKSDSEASGNPEIQDDTETFCDRCAWHGKFRELS